MNFERYHLQPGAISVLSLQEMEDQNLIKEVMKTSSSGSENSEDFSWMHTCKKTYINVLYCLNVAFFNIHVLRVLRLRVS